MTLQEFMCETKSLSPQIGMTLVKVGADAMEKLKTANLPAEDHKTVQEYIDALRIVTHYAGEHQKAVLAALERTIGA
jgi:hypothetical protein